MNEKFFLGLEDNFEIESRMIGFSVKSVMTFNDLSEAEKAEFFGEIENRVNYTRDLVFSMLQHHHHIY